MLRRRLTGRARMVPAAAVAALLLAGCGTAVAPSMSQPAPPSATATPAESAVDTPAPLDACQLVTKKDAEALAGTPLDEGQAGNPLSPSCVYTGPVSGPLGQVSVYVGGGAKKTYDIDVELNHEFESVPDIGDEAYVEDNAIFFRKGSTWVAIELVRLNDPSENRGPLEKLASDVVLRLP